ncbi:hypothetical protein [Lihuaxuella thermophila]|uniref:Uncharacterized protein n=1 Tax=Lihuaxuella thermophila TaxID=1173111 RepID=A0A1H8CYN4_9BACL|nr:hypothetical protein [Lihuaxuella thermophila]SEM99488.1 hypothetical protein SAMN05444955_104160 [Lihuaxuella thermophila]
MLTMLVQGQANRVMAFLNDLQQRPQIEMLHQEVQGEKMEGDVDVKVTCYVKHCPERRLRMINMETVDGTVIVIPLLDAVCVEIDAGTKIFSGRVFDIFA